MQEAKSLHCFSPEPFLHTYPAIERTLTYKSSLPEHSIFGKMHQLILVAVHYAKIAPNRTIVRYLSKPAITRSKRFEERVVYEPVINISRYETKAVIDYVVIELNLARKTQGQHLSRVLSEFVKVTASASPKDKNPSKGDSRTTDSFLVKFLDADLRSVEMALEIAEKKYGFNAKPSINEMEVSVDFYSMDADAGERRLMTAILMRHLFPPAYMIAEEMGRQRYWDASLAKEKKIADAVSVLSGNPAKVIDAKTTFRGLGGKFDPWMNILDRTRISKLKLDGTMYFGKDAAPRRMRVMDKITDKEHKITHERIILDQEDCRSRVEVTLDRLALAELGVVSFVDLKKFSFAKLQGKFFRFMLPTFSEKKIKPVTFEQTRRRAREYELTRLFCATSVTVLYEIERYLTQVEERFIKRRKSNKPNDRGNVLGDRGNLVAFEELNKAVRAALNNLSARTF